MKKNITPPVPLNNFQQTNAFAMQHGLFMGGWALVVQLLFITSLQYPTLSLFHLIGVCLIPVLLLFFTFRFRYQVAYNTNFSFARGAAHSFLLSVYTGVWAGLFAFVYLYFFDQGFIFDLYEKKFSAPEIQQMLIQTGFEAQLKQNSGKGVIDILKEMRNIPASSYAASIIYLYLMFAPVFSLLAGMLTMRKTYRVLR